MIIVGLTGGISTGKSTVSHYISSLKIPLLDADVAAREIVQPGSAAYHKIVDHFGSAILNSSSFIDRGLLGNIIFSNPEERAVLNEITHPRIRLVLLKKVIYNFLILKRMVVLDTPLLFEAGLYRWVHSTVVVYCPFQKQLERLMSRDGISEAAAKQKIDSQMPIEQKKTLAHHVIDNSNTIAETYRQTDGLIKELEPSTLSVLIMWGIFFWPAFWAYWILHLYDWVDHARNTGFIFKKTIPKGVQGRTSYLAQAG